jgi:hypothetical protein
MYMVALVFSLALTLFGLGVSSRVHHQWGPLLLGGMSAVTLVIARYRFDLFAAIVATTTLVAAAIWNWLLNRRTIHGAGIRGRHMS